MPVTYPEDSWINPKCEIRSSSIHGRGMFTQARFEAGDVVAIWGRMSGTKQQAGQAREQGKVVMQLDDDLYTIEERGDDDTYFMNHSCDPNVWMANAWTLVARRNILDCEELTLDHALVESDENFVADWKCACGSSECRRTITGRDWMFPGLQWRYEGHCSPLINKRISRLKER